MTSNSIDVVVRGQALIGESPVWDDRSAKLLWVDVLRGEVHASDIDTGSDVSVRIGTAVGSLALRSGSGLVLGAGDGFALLEHMPWEAPAGSRDEPRPEWIWRLGSGDVDRFGPSGLPVRMNDAKCDPNGRLWGGTMTVDRVPGACYLYRLDPDRKIRAVLDGVTLSNGLGWSPDGTTMYYIDTPRRTVDAFDFDSEAGTVARRRVLVDMGEGVGNPDGMTVDADGCLWIAIAHGAAVRRYTPEGSIDRTLEFPARKVTSCTFGGSKLDVLVVTSACVGMSEQELVAEPLAGAVFACDVGSTGIPPSRFGG